MSVSVMSLVWERSRAKGGDLGVLLAIADNADDDGLAWPGFQYLAAKSRMSKNTVRRHIKNLEEVLREIEVQRSTGGRVSHRYVIQLDRLRSQPVVVPKRYQYQSGTGAKSETPGVPPCAPRGAGSDTRIINESSMNHHRRTARDAFDLIATRRMTMVSNVRDPRAYRAKALRGIQQEHGPRAAEILTTEPDLSPAELADRLEPPASTVTAVRTDAQVFASRIASHRAAGEHEEADLLEAVGR
jgi:hypothetical protein